VLVSQPRLVFFFYVGLTRLATYCTVAFRKVGCVCVHSEQRSLELSKFTTDDINSAVEETLSQRGVRYSEPLDDLRTKFNVRNLLWLLIIMMYI